MVADRLLIDVTDYIRFRAMCPKWRSSTSDPHRMRVPPQLPWLMLSFNEIETNARSFYILSDCKTVIFGYKFLAKNRIISSTDGCLVLIDELTAMHLFDPLTEDMIHLPSLESLPDIVSFDEQNVENEYLIQFYRGDRVYFEDSDTMRDLFVSKVVISLSEHNQSNQLVMACVRNHGKLVFAKIGDATWTTIGFPFVYFTDILYYKDRFYAVNMFGRLIVCDLTPSAEVVPLTHAVYNGAAHWYLVESTENLLVVSMHSIWHARWVRQLKKFEVFMVENLNSNQHKFVKMRSLGDEILFLGSSQSMSLSVRDFPGWRCNNIYLTTGSFVLCHAPMLGKDHEMDCNDCCLDIGHGGDDLGVFNLADGSINSIPCYPDNTQFVWPPPI